MPVPELVYWYIATDFAIGEKETNDYTVLLPFAVDKHGDLYFADPVRERLNAFEIVEKLIDMIEKYQPMRVALEKTHITKAIGPLLNQRMRERGCYVSFFEGTPSKDKQTRARSLQGRMQQGKIHLPDTYFFHEVWLHELLAFPAGKHDDIVDAMSWACLMLDELIEPAPNAEVELPTIEEDSWEDLQRRGVKGTRTDRHRPQSLFAHLPKPAKKEKPVKW